jgi:hypothetical protein
LVIIDIISWEALLSMFIGEYNYAVVSTQRKYSGRVRRFIDFAAKMANQSCDPVNRHGAVLVKGSSVLNASHNKNSFCSFGQRFREKGTGVSTMHAELGAILGMDRKITEGATVYVARVGKKGNLKLYTINGEMAGSYKL